MKCPHGASAAWLPGLPGFTPLGSANSSSVDWPGSRLPFLQTRALIQSQKQVLFKALDYKTFSLFPGKGQWEAGSWGSRGSGPQPHITVTTSFAINHGPQENTPQDSTQHARSSQPEGRAL